MHEHTSDAQSTLVWRSHLAVVATKTPNKIIRTLRTTAMVLVQWVLLLKFLVSRGCTECMSATLQLVIWGPTESVTVAENLSG